MTILTKEVTVVNAIVSTTVESDTVDLPFVTNSVFCTSAGDIVVTLDGMLDGTAVTYPLTVGDSLPLRIKRLFSTGSTAVVFLQE